MRSRNTGCLLLASSFVFTAACSTKTSTPPAAIPTKPSVIPLARSITIPARVAADPAVAPSDAGILTMTEGGDDELPEGPTSFDVLPDGGFVIADPLRQRIAFYDSTGKFISDLLIYFSAERLRVLPDKSLSIVRYQTGERFIFGVDSSGRYAAPRLATDRDPDLDATDAGVVKLESGSLATVNARPGPGIETAPVALRFEALGESMVSVRRLGTDARQRTYCAIEAAFPGQRVDVRKIIRKYSAQSESLVELMDIPLDYFVHPVDEFRIREGMVYQLMPKASEVRINIWNTVSRP